MLFNVVLAPMSCYMGRDVDKVLVCPIHSPTLFGHAQPGQDRGVKAGSRHDTSFRVS